MFKFLQQLKVQLTIVVLLVFVLNWNTFSNEYALDDDIVIHQNLNVQAGVSGIGEILSTDAFQGFLDSQGAESPLSGGRYRPLSIVTFALEQSFFGETYGLEYREELERLRRLEKHGATQQEIGDQIKKLDTIKAKIQQTTLQLSTVRHVVQVILFALSMMVLLVFLTRHVFVDKPLLAFATVLLFVAHPVHTEVIANIKSRDEIMSLLFIVLTLHYSFNYIKHRSGKNLGLLLLAFLLALLSKEYSMVLPFIIVVGWSSLLKLERSKLVNPALIGLFGVAAIFMLIRFTTFSNSDSGSSITDVLNDPYLYAEQNQIMPSKIAVLLEYGRVLCYPKALSSDYSYNHFAYIDSTHWKYWTSMLLYFGLVIGFLYAWYKQKKIAFPLAIFIAFFFLINNTVFNIGATMGERLVYHSSLGFCIIIVMGLEWILNKAKRSEHFNKIVGLTLLVPILVLFSFKTINRNPEWKTNYTLFSSDIKTVPKSALVNNNVATEIYNRAFATFIAFKKPTKIQQKTFRKELKRAVGYFNKTLVIHDRYVVAFMNRGLCHYYLGDNEKAGNDWVKAAELFNGPHSFLKRNSYIFYNEGVAYGSKKQYKESIKPLFIASKMNPTDGVIWNNLGGAYFMTGQFKLASDAFAKALQLNPNLVDAKNGKGAADNIYLLEQQVISDSTNLVARRELGIAYQNCGLPKEILTVKL